MRRRKLWTSISLIIIAAASLGLLLWTIDHKAYLRLQNGVAMEIAHGVFLVHVWDTSFYRIEYPPGLSFGDNHENMWFWAPMVHLNGPPAYYAAPGFHQWVVTIPLWMISLGAIAGFVLAWRAGWMGRKAGLCPGCGYDIRALPSDRCPECGESLPVDIAAPA